MSPVSIDMPAPIAVQLYSLREASKVDFDAVLEKVADIGYRGVEPFNLYGKSPTEFRRQVEDLGMQICSSHYPWSNHTENFSEVVEVIQALGLSRVPGGFMPPDFADMQALQRTIIKTRDLVAQCQAHGLTLFLHNHFWEFEPIEGQTAYHYLQDDVPDVEFELDTYWAANFGKNDPVTELQRVRERCPLLHIKDGPLTRDAANVAVGQGQMDIAAVVNAADPDVLEWVVVELDKCNGDMFTAVADSYTYLTDNQIALGNR